MIILEKLFTQNSEENTLFVRKQFKPTFEFVPCVFWAWVLVLVSGPHFGPHLLLSL